MKLGLLLLLFQGCSHLPVVPAGPAPSCDVACQNVSKVCPQAASGCVDLCSPVTNPGFRSCLSVIENCDQANLCDDAVQGQRLKPKL